MKEITKDIKTKIAKTGKSEVVASIVIPVYEALEEAVEVFTPEALLQLINSQNQANLMNAKRAEYRPSKSGKKRLFKEAYQYCFENYPEELTSNIGDLEKLQAYVEGKIEEMQTAAG